MVPALTASQKTAAKPVRRLGVVYHPNGVVYENWLPTGVGADFEFSRVLSPLAAVPRSRRRRHRACRSDRPKRSATAAAITHARPARISPACTSRSPTAWSCNGVSMDQIAAKAFERETQLSSLQLTVDNNNLVGSCDAGYSCAYSNTLSWLTPTLPLMSENDPRVVFERLFGVERQHRSARAHGTRFVRTGAFSTRSPRACRQLQQKLGAADNTKVSDYLESLRDVERRIQKAEEQSARELPEVDRPVGIPDSFDEHVTLLYDLQVLAYQCDLTRVITFMYGREQSARTYPQLGISDPHHQLTHHQNDPEKLEKCTKIQTHHVDAVHGVPGEAPVDTGRRRIAARSHGASCSAAG